MARCCEAPNCESSIFSHGYCKYHQFVRKRYGGDLYVPKSKQNKGVEPRSLPRRTKLPPESKTRKKEHIYYTQGCKQLEQEIRDQNQGRIYDFFTGKEIIGFVTWHHLLGRTGDYYLDKDLLVPAENDENDGHLFWHRATVEQLMQKEWYQGFLERLLRKSETAFNKEINKVGKTVNLFNN